MITRSITGLILGGIMVSCLLFSLWSASLLLIIILLFSSREWYKHFVEKNGQLPQSVFLIFILVFFAIILFSLISHSAFMVLDGLNQLNVMLIFFLSVFAYATYFNKDWPFCFSWYSGILYIGFPILICFSFLNEQYDDNRWIILGLIIINWSNDVFAYFTGRLFGKHSLAPEISPKKTIEGAAGGLLAAIISSIIVNEYIFIQQYSLGMLFILGFSIWLAGTLGDLYESKMKRLVGIKDSGNILPGHGGFLDRFDSFFFIVPVGIFVLSF